MLFHNFSVLEGIQDGLSATSIEVKRFYRNYKLWAERNNMRVLSDGKIGMLLTRFLDTQYVAMSKDGVVTKYYNSINYRTAARQHQDPWSLVLPEYMSIKILQDIYVIELSTPFMNDDYETIKLVVQMNRQNCHYSIYLNEQFIAPDAIGLSGISYMDQIFVDALVKLGRKMKLCLGNIGHKDLIEKSDKAHAVEIVKQYQNGGSFENVVFTRIKHTRCFGYVNLMGSGKTFKCRPCQHKINQKFLDRETKTYVSAQLINPEADDISRLIRKHGGLPMDTDGKIVTKKTETASKPQDGADEQALTAGNKIQEEQKSTADNNDKDEDSAGSTSDEDQQVQLFGNINPMAGGAVRFSKPVLMETPLDFGLNETGESVGQEEVTRLLMSPENSQLVDDILRSNPSLLNETLSQTEVQNKYLSQYETTVL